jgi:integrase
MEAIQAFRQFPPPQDLATTCRCAGAPQASKLESCHSTVSVGVLGSGIFLKRRALASRALNSTSSSRARAVDLTIEQGALRLGEAVSLRCGDVDAANLRLRLPRSATKRDRARWIYLPEWLIETIEATCPLEDRTPERRVFQGITEASAYQAMSRACRNGKMPHYHPHDLRHRRITIWHQSGVPARELAERAGHAKPSMSLDVYSHVMPPDEASSDRLQGLLP